MKKKIVAILCTVAMSMSMVTTALASGNVTILDSGKCGDAENSADWQLQSDGMMTIQGEGYAYWL